MDNKSKLKISKNAEIKMQIVDDLYTKIASSNPASKDKGLNTVVVDYSKFSANEFNTLRSNLFEVGASLKIVKNTLIKKMFDKFGVKTNKDLEDLSGQSALLIADKDFVPSIKLISDFIKKSLKGSFKLGVLEGEVINQTEVVKLAKLPAKEVLVGQVLSGLVSPIKNFAFVLNGTQSNFVRALSAIADKKSKSA